MILLILCRSLLLGIIDFWGSLETALCWSEWLETYRIWVVGRSNKNMPLPMHSKKGWDGDDDFMDSMAVSNKA